MDALELGPGDAYGEYRILEPLGRGTFAAVYKVESPSFEGPMALKLSHDAVGADEQAQRALREISILGSLTNPHVVRLYRSGLAPDGRVFLLMEWLDGASLDQVRPSDVPLPPARAVQLIHQACLGLAEAHDREIVHRDLKPENLWIRQDGTVVVLDFGLARSWNHSTPAGAPATVGHMMVGTPHYTQPEQVQGGQLTPASDVYSLGTLLYELLTGRAPFFEMTVSQARDHLKDDAIGWLRAHCLNPVVPIEEQTDVDLPPALVDLIGRCLSKAPQGRPPHAGALANELGEILYHDFGVALAATLRITHAYGGHEDRQLFPGSYRIGADAGCELRIHGDGVSPVAAVIEWTGAPRQPLLRATSETPVQHNAQVIAQPVELATGDTVRVADAQLQLVSVPSA
jgi:serine/threonine-protein kinase